MPFIDVKVIEGVLSTEQKQAIARGFTDVFVEATSESLRGVTWVVVQDVASGQWAIGGEAITTDKVKGLIRGERVHA